MTKRIILVEKCLQKAAAESCSALCSIPLSFANLSEGILGEECCQIRVFFVVFFIS